MDIEKQHVYRIDSAPGSSMELEETLERLESEGWEIVAIFPYRPGSERSELIWEPNVVMRRSPVGRE